MTDYRSSTTEPGTILPVVLSTTLAIPLDQNPASIYLASLNKGSRRTMHTALNTLGALLGVGEVVDSEGRDVRCLAVLWGNLRSEHTAAIRAKLEARYAPATANKLHNERAMESHPHTITRPTTGNQHHERAYHASTTGIGTPETGTTGIADCA